MARRKYYRKHVRLLYYKSLGVLSQTGLPSVPCSVSDLSEGGCRCRVDLTGLDGLPAEKLVTLMRPRERVEIEFRGEPNLEGTRFAAEVRHAKAVDQKLLELGLEFRGLAGEQHQRLSQALQVLCLERLRTPSQVKPAVPAPEAEGAAALTKTALLRKADFKGMKLGEILVHMGALTGVQLMEAIQAAHGEHHRLGRCLLARNLVATEDICEALSLQSGLPTVDLGEIDIPHELHGRFSYLTLRKLEFIPFQQGRDVLSIAAARPLSSGDLADLEKKAGSQVLVYLAPEDVVLARIMGASAQQRHERRHPRYRVALPVTLQFCHREGQPLNDRTVHGRVLDVSEGGFRVQGEEPGAGPLDNLVRDGVIVRATLSAGSQPIHTVCDLRFAKAVETPDPTACCMFGLRISEICEADRLLLRELCIRSGILRMQKRFV